MIKVYEIKETISDSKLMDNLYAINKITKELIKQTEFIQDINKDDLDYINIALEKIKINLEKAYLIINI